VTYQKLLKKLRGVITQDALAKSTKLHRNTVIKAESEEPVKFDTIAKLMHGLGYADSSQPMREIALLWLKAVSGINFSNDDAEAAFQELLDSERLKLQPLLDRLGRIITENALTPEQIALLCWAASSSPVMEILRHARTVAEFQTGSVYPFHVDAKVPDSVAESGRTPDGS